MILRKCTYNGCTVLTIGSRCVEHDVPVRRTFVRGRPYAAAVSPQPPILVARQHVAGTSLVPSRRTIDTFARP